MVNIKRFYNAVVTRTVNGLSVTKNEKINISDLSSVDFDKVVINEDVFLPNGKGQPLPDFSNVYINGSFDCSSFSITKDSVLPRGINVLKCFYSLNDLSILNGILPDSVKKVYVRNAIINSIKKDVNSFKAAEDFLVLYPNVEVIGKSEDLNLQNVVVSIKSSESQQKAVSQLIDKASSANTLNNKQVYAGYSDVSAAALELKNLDEFKDIDIKDLKKSIKTFLYKNADNDEWGNVKNYILTDKLPDLAISLLTETEEQSTDKKVNTENVKNNEIQPVVETVSKKIEEIEPIKIKKFFNKSVWSSVYKACKGNKPLLLKLLTTINDINLHPTQNRLVGGAGRVVYLKDGAMKVASSLELKNSCYLSQGFGRDNNRPRIVWCILSDGTFVASEFFANHGDGKNKSAYNTYIMSNNQKDRIEKYFADNRSEYLDVKKLLMDLKKEKKQEEYNKLEPKLVHSDVTEDLKEQQIIVQENISEQKKIESLPVPEIEIKEVVVAADKSVKRGRPKKQKKAEESDKKDVLFEANYTLTDVFEVMNKHIVEIKQRLTSETDTVKSLGVLKTLSEKLEEKQWLEKNIETVWKAFDILKQYMQIGIKQR